VLSLAQMPLQQSSPLTQVVPVAPHMAMHTIWLLQAMLQQSVLKMHGAPGWEQPGLPHLASLQPPLQHMLASVQKSPSG
jgi:hypothetical protein